MKFAALSRTVFVVLMLPLLPVNTDAQGLHVDVEEFRRLQGEVADLRDANSSYQKRISELTRRIEKLQEDIREANERSTMKMGDLITREELKKVIDRIADVDEKRENDRKVILDQFEKLEKTLTSSLTGGSGSRSGTRTNPRDRDRDVPKEPKESKTEVIEGKFLEYVVPPDKPLSIIIQEYNAVLKGQGLPPIRQSDVMKANPNLNPNRIFAGQKIQLPVPEKK